MKQKDDEKKKKGVRERKPNYKELGFEQQRTKATRGYVVVERSAQEIKERLKDLAFQVTDDG